LAPDREWLAFTQRMSRGALGSSDDRVFDPQSQFVAKQFDRRANLEGYISHTGAIRINEEFLKPGAIPKNP
jgi:hypothetical protein